MFNSSNQLKKLRLFLNLTQDDFAERINSKRNSISMIESGRNKPTFDMITDICKAFDISADYFLSDINPSDAQQFLNNNIVIKDNNNVGNDVNLNVNDDVNLNGKKRVKSTDLSQKNTEYLKGKTWFSDKVFEEAISSTYSLDQLTAKTKKLRDLQTSYYNKVNRELDKSHENLYKTMRLAENVDALADLIWTAVSAYINARPNPFDAFQYLDLQNKTEHIPDTIEYKEYKQNVITWLETIEQYQDIIKEFYNHGEHFLKQIKPLDTDGIID